MADNENAHALLAESRIGILATLQPNGRPHLSPVTPYYDREAGKIYVSMREGLVKTRNLRRDPRVSIEATRSDGWAWATAEGTAELVGPGGAVDSAEVDALVDYYRAAAGEHPDWQEYREAMVNDRRVLMVMSVERVYGQALR